MKIWKLILTLTLTSLLLKPAFSEEQPTKTTPTGPFLITNADINASDCDEYFDKLLKQKQFTQKEAMFRKAVCRFHKPLFQSDVVELEKTITLLRNLQTQGLWASQQTLAAFMEGLLQCRQTKLALNKLTQLDNKTLRNQQLLPLAKMNLCATRRGAIASFADINWAYARFDYQDNLSNNISDLLDEMALCYSSEDGPLNPKFNEVCQILRLPQQRVQAIIEDEADKVIQDKFGAKSPIAKIFLENKKLAESYTQNATQAIKDLKQDSENVVNVHRKLDTHFNDEINKPLTQLVEDYKKAYSVGKSILDKYAQWQRGLLKEGNKDLTLDLIGDSDKYGKTGIEGRVKKQVKQIDVLIKKAKEIPSLISKLQKKDLETRNRIRKLCKIYYCEFRQEGTFNLDTLKKACEPDEMRANPLCKTDSQFDYPLCKDEEINFDITGCD